MSIHDIQKIIDEAATKKLERDIKKYLVDMTANELWPWRPDIKVIVGGNQKGTRSEYDFNSFMHPTMEGNSLSGFTRFLFDANLEKYKANASQKFMEKVKKHEAIFSEE